MSISSFLLQISLGIYAKPDKISEVRWSGMMKWLITRGLEGNSLHNLMSENC